MIKKKEVCICQRCSCDCLFRTESVNPVIKIVRNHLWNDEDPFIAQLLDALKNFTCEHFTEGRNK